MKLQASTSKYLRNAASPLQARDPKLCFGPQHPWSSAAAAWPRQGPWQLRSWEKQGFNLSKDPIPVQPVANLQIHNPNVQCGVSWGKIRRSTCRILPAASFKTTERHDEVVTWTGMTRLKGTHDGQYGSCGLQWGES